MKEIKIQEEFIYNGFGFPVVLRNVPMIKVLNSIWTPCINYEKLIQIVFDILESNFSKLDELQRNFVKYVRLENL